MTAQLRLFEAPMAGLMPLSMDDANRLLVTWGHRLGAVHRPFGQEAYALEVQGQPVSLATSGSVVNPPRGWQREELVELTRLCSAPGSSWATVIMIRLWRELCAPAWPYWPVKAAVSYSQNDHHRGGIYRWDGWERVSEHCGATRPTTAWGRERYADAPQLGPKSLWIWRYEQQQAAQREEA